MDAAAAPASLKRTPLHVVTLRVFRFLQRRRLFSYCSKLHGPIWHSWKPEARLQVAR
jgi:hypothetical protein